MKTQIIAVRVSGVKVHEKISRMLLLLALVLLVPVSLRAQVTAVPANDFLNTMGVNTHVEQGYPESSYEAPFKYTGIRNARDGYSNTSGLVTLHNNTVVAGSYPGVFFNICPGSGNGDLIGFHNTLDSFAASGYLISIEGPNEPINWPLTYNGQLGGGSGTWIPVAQYQRDLFAAVLADPVLKNYPVFSVSLGGGETDNVGLQFLTIPTGAGCSMPDGTAYADYANCHNYVCGNGQVLADNNAWYGASPTHSDPNPAGVDGFYGEYDQITWAHHYTAYTDAQAQPLPRVTTETGWNTGSNNTPYGPLSFTYGPSTPFVTGQTLGTSRNNFTGWVGYRFTVGSSPITVNQLGRWVVSGNTGTHSVKLVLASTGVDVPNGSVTITTSGAATGSFKYAPITPTTLTANTIYYLMSHETNGGDSWYSNNTVVTTTGVSTINNSTYYDSSYHNYGGPITEDQQGKIYLHTYLSQFARGWAYTYIYEMRDNEGGTYNGGLYHGDWTPKLSATYIHNFTTILTDIVSNPASSLNYSIPGEPATVHDLLLQKSDGTFYLVVWDERPFGEGTDNVTVNLGSNYGTVKVNVYDPTVGTTASQILTDVRSVPLTLSDHPLILAISAPPSIGVQFQGNGTALAATDSAGLSSVAQAHWNVLTGISYSGQILSDGSGTVTTATLSGNPVGAWVGGGSTAPPAGNTKLASGEVWNGTTSGSHVLTVSSIPYAAYDVYVYASVDTAGRNETVSLTPTGAATQYYSFKTQLGGSAWTVATSTWSGTGTPPSLPSANYVHYSGLTASKFTMSWWAAGNGAVNAIQIVPVPMPSIGIQFQGNGTALAATDSAGILGLDQTHWNILTGISYSAQILSDNNGNATTATLSGNPVGAWTGGGSTAPPAGNTKLASGEVWNGSTSGSHALTVSSIPYATYDVYVYASIDAAGRNETVSLTPSGGATQYYSFATQKGGSTWTAATSTWSGTGTPPSLPSANYAHYSGLTAANFTMTWWAVGNGAINAIQIVPTP